MIFNQRERTLMSDAYTHKIILFTGDNYTGEALVAMQPFKNKEYGQLLLKKFYCFNKVSPTTYYSRNFESASVRSLIVDQGAWNICEAFNQETQQENITPVNSSLSNIAQYISKLEPDQTAQNDSIACDLQRDEGGATDSLYDITFYPLENAFTIWPAPPFKIKQTENANFRWMFKDGDLLRISWRIAGDVDDPNLQNGIVIENPKLVFNRHNPNASLRPSPVQVQIDPSTWTNVDIMGYPDNYKKPNDNSHVIRHQGEAVKIQVVNEDAEWSFDFECTIDNVQYIVDPEMQIGTGVRRS